MLRPWEGPEDTVENAINRVNAFFEFCEKLGAGKHDFKSLEQYMLKKREAQPNKSGRQELLENVVNRYVF